MVIGGKLEVQPSIKIKAEFWTDASSISAWQTSGNGKCILKG